MPVGEVLSRAARGLALVTVLEVGVGLLLGSGAWWLGWTRPPIKDFFVALLGVALSAVVGIAACLALVREPPKHPQWVFMGLFGIGFFTIGALGAAIGVGTMLYAFLLSKD